MRATTGVTVHVNEEPDPCSECRGPMEVQKTRSRTGKTIEHGEFKVRETVHICESRCRRPSGALATQRSTALSERILPRSVAGYDTMVRVGLERFLQFRQREEIRTILKADTGVSLSERQISYLAHRFLRYLEALHKDRSPQLKAALAADGGSPLHVDATGEDGRGTLLVAFAGWRRWVLDAWKIPTEREDQILPRLRATVQRFGAPCAIMRDLGRAVIPAVKALVAELGLEIPIFSCQLHFLKDVGKDLLKTHHNQLRLLFRESKVRPRLGALARDLGRKLGVGIHAARSELSAWLESGQRGLPSGACGLATVRALAQWVLDYPVEGNNLRFPFDRPYLDLYERSLTVRLAVDDFLRKPALDPIVIRSLGRLERAVDSVVQNAAFTRAAESLGSRARLFDQLRAVLRLDHAASKPQSSVRKTSEDVQVIRSELDKIRIGLERFRVSLQEMRSQRSLAHNKRKAIDVIERHLQKYGDSLWGHVIVLPPEAGGGIRFVDRTNNVEESFFGQFKHNERRRSGRKVLTQDFENLPAAAALTPNLRQPDYLAILCGSLDDLPRAFAQLDATKRSGGAQACEDSRSTQQWDIASASLPRDDRGIVRSEALNAAILSAALSPPPRDPVLARP